MNKLYRSFSILLLATMLSGCMTSFIGARFDNNEYFLINSISNTKSDKIKQKDIIHLYYINKNMCKLK